LIGLSPSEKGQPLPSEQAMSDAGQASSWLIIMVNLPIHVHVVQGSYLFFFSFFKKTLKHLSITWY